MVDQAHPPVQSLSDSSKRVEILAVEDRLVESEPVANHPSIHQTRLGLAKDEPIQLLVMVEFNPAIVPDQQKLALICQRHAVGALRVFGSVARGQAVPTSDIDLLVDFLPTARPSLLTLGGLLMDLRDLLQRDVDLRTIEELPPHARARALQEAVTLYGTN